MPQPVRIAITGGAGQISYSLIFRIAAGDLFGPSQPVILQLLEISAALEALNGTMMEVTDCAFPLVHGMFGTDKAEEAFADADVCLLVGAKPRGKGMERGDLLKANADIFSVQGKAINDVAARATRVLVVGNPANTNALITMANAPDMAPTQFSAMMRLDHNRALGQLALKTDTHVTEIDDLMVWGNHSATQFPDIGHCRVAGQPATALVEREWYRETFIPTVQQRGAAIISARGASSAASAASAAIDQMRDWVQGCEGIVSMAIPAEGSYGIEPGIVFSYPVRCRDGGYHIVTGFELDDFARDQIAATERELREEREAIAHLLG